VTLSSCPYLALKTGSGDRQLSLLGGNYWTVGRGDDNNLVLPDRWISRNHAMLQSADDGQFYLVDLGSRNGTFVNGRRVSVPVILYTGDLITFGQTEVRFFAPQSSPVVADLALEIKAGMERAPTAILKERQLISLMVVDIRDFTVLIRQIDEKVLSEAIGTWFRRAGEIISQYDSWVDKYVGDALMAVWIHGNGGADYDQMLHILQTVSTLAEMTGQIHQQFPLPFPLRIGAGINTGYAMVGNTATGDRPVYTALGDTVDAAFHLEASTKPLGLDVAMGQTTYHFLQKAGGDDLCFKRFTVDLKDYEESLTTYAGTFSDLNQWLAKYA
jgi:adenylate cyclase